MYAMKYTDWKQQTLWFRSLHLCGDMISDTGMLAATLDASDTISHSLIVSYQQHYYPTLHLVERLEF